ETDRRVPCASLAPVYETPLYVYDALLQNEHAWWGRNARTESQHVVLPPDDRRNSAFILRHAEYIVQPIFAKSVIWMHEWLSRISGAISIGSQFVQDGARDSPLNSMKRFQQLVASGIGTVGFLLSGQPLRSEGHGL